MWRGKVSVYFHHGITPPRHITGCATEEILCGPPHNSSYSHSEPSGSALVASNSIGEMNVAFIFVETGIYEGILASALNIGPIRHVLRSPSASCLGRIVH
jgi:hypothetical protein